MLRVSYKTLEEEHEEEMRLYDKKLGIRELAFATWDESIEAEFRINSHYYCVILSIDLDSPEDSHKAVACLVRVFGEGRKRFYAESGHFYWTFSKQIGDTLVEVHLNKASAGQCKIVEEEVTIKRYRSVCPESEGGAEA